MTRRSRLAGIARLFGGKPHADGEAELHVGDPRFDDWEVVRDFEELEAARALRSELAEMDPADAARTLGDCLIVCLNSDDSVRRIKGAARPILPEDDRVDLLLALECVDAVLIFGEDTPDEALRRIRPDLWVKGGDYSAESLPETATVAEWGGRVLTVPYHPGRSTTHLAAALARVG